MTLKSNGTASRSIPKQQNIAVLMHGFDGWAGGVDFIRLLVNSLHTRNDKVVHLLIPRPTLYQTLRRAAGTLPSRLRRALRGQFSGVVRKRLSPDDIVNAFSDFDRLISIHIYRGTRRRLIHVLTEIDADVVLPAIESLGIDFPVPWVGYICDFQHRHLPHFFSQSESAKRDNQFSRMLDEAPVVIVNALDVLNDAHRYYPGSCERIVSLPFAPMLRPEWLNLDHEAIREKYRLPERYFIVCNQFWIHKDHPTAISAYAEFLRMSGQDDVGLVCTGSLNDYRAPGYANSIVRQIAQLGLQSKVQLLGYVPKADQIAILYGAIAVIQPTLFEGGPGGGAVFDAVALGVPSFVTDLPVNRELGDGPFQFFEPRNVGALADLMMRSIQNSGSRPSQSQLIRDAESRKEQLANALIRAITRAVEMPTWKRAL